jgi:GT2 family glycosyltransferase/tetratricopeptide (TPR) repeat protein
MGENVFQRLVNGLARPFRFRTRIRLAQAAKRAGRFQEAAEHYRAALALAPRELGTKVQLANMLKDSRAFDEAEAVYRDALTADPLSADTHLQLGHLLKLTGRRGVALESYRRALELDPLSAAARRELIAAGETAQRLEAFEVQMRQGGTEALLSIRSQLDTIARQVDDIRRSLPDAQASAAYPVDAYSEFRRLYDVPPPTNPVATLSIAIVLIADREPLEGLQTQISAIRAQAYGRWTLSVIGLDGERRDVVDRTAASDRRITWIETAPDAVFPQGEIEAALDADADWSLLLASGAVLHPQALAWVAEAAARTACDGMIMDEETGEIGPYSSGLHPILRQTFDRDTLLQANVFGDTIAVRTTALKAAPISAAPRSAAGARGALLLALSDQGRVAHLPLPLVRRVEVADEPSRLADHAAAVRAHLSGGTAATVSVSGWSDAVLTIESIPRDDESRIAVVIPTRNNSHDVDIFVSSLFSLARQPDLIEVLILNNGAPLAEDALLARVAERAGVTVSELPEPFNWSRFSNLGAARTEAPYLVFANDDMRMLTRDWDHRLRALLERPEVGAVGARLLYPDDTVQHAGVLFDWQGSVIHDGLYQPIAAAGPAQRWHTTRSVSAVTGAFLATRRSVFDSVGGFDDVHLAISYSDIDYALKLRAEGLRVLWTPQITLYHYESKTRGLDHLHPAKAARNAAERKVMDARWGDAMNREPSLNPMWRQAALPHRLLSYPSEARVWAHIRLAATTNPWRVERVSG